MSIEYSSLYKNFQSIIGSYQDIAAIYTKLFSQGQIQKLGSVITEIYDEEHVFTLTELQKYCIESRQKEDDFVAEQYEMNSSIFRRNLTLIVQNLVEEIGKKYLDRFRQDFVSATNVEREENQSEPVEQVVEEEEVPEQEQEVAHQRIAEPQIQERMEINERKTNANRIESKSLVLEGENKANGNKSFDINMNELAHKAKVQVHKTSQSANEISSQVSRPQGVENYQSNKKVSPVNYEFEDNSKQVSPSYNKADGSTFAYSEAKGEEYSQYDNETGAFRLSQEKFHSASRNKPNQETYQFWSSSEKNSVQERQTYSSPQEAKVASPEKFGASMFGYSYSKWSTTNGRPDMSILDSEFSYGQGRSFSKSPKKFHHRIQDIPGPGRYELEESMQYTKATSPNRSFTKSPKTPSYFKKSAVPGAIYYPTKHFLSK